MLKEFSWNIFKQTGDPRAYLVYKGTKGNCKDEMQDYKYELSKDFRDGDKGNNNWRI